MIKGINLAGERIDPKQLELQKKVKRLRILSLGVLFVICLVSVVLFVIIIASPLPSLRQKEEQLFLSLNKQNSKIQKVIFVDKQLGHIGKIMETRSTLPEVLQKVMASAPSGLVLETYSAGTNIFEVAIQGQNLSDMQAFIDSVYSLAQRKEIYQNISVSELSLLPASGSYRIRITMTK